jgi:hypothetical protein
MSVVQFVPMCRLTERIVRSGLVTAWRLATSPTSTSPPLDHATTDGVVRAPSAFAITWGSPPSMTDTTELVVPRSMPTALAMAWFLLGPVRSGPAWLPCAGAEAAADRSRPFASYRKGAAHPLDTEPATRRSDLSQRLSGPSRCRRTDRRSRRRRSAEQLASGHEAGQRQVPSGRALRRGPRGRDPVATQRATTGVEPLAVRMEVEQQRERQQHEEHGDDPAARPSPSLPSCRPCRGSDRAAPCVAAPPTVAAQRPAARPRDDVADGPRPRRRASPPPTSSAAS